jgi:Plasmid pRiA4b ORF-3-like protein
MARTWLQIRVELEGGRDIECDPRPGRVFIVGPSHTFADLATAIDAAFARWDLSHLHLFEMPDGRQIGYPDPDFEQNWLDHAALKVARELSPGDEFTYTFDLGDDWRHHCRVLAEKADPIEEYGHRPRQPVPIWGWGWIPDQYGRETLEDDELG